MESPNPVKVVWIEDGSAVALGRLASDSGTGDWTGVEGEGNFLKQADIDTITYKVFDRSTTTPDTAILTGTLTLSSVIFDTPVKDKKLWPDDDYGYNFKHTLPTTAFPTGDNVIRVEYKITTVGSAVGWGIYEGPVESVVTS